MKKGFTLIELLAVIIVLSIVFGFVASNVMKAIDKTIDEEYKLLSSIMESAAEVYVEEEKPEELEEIGGTYCVTLENMANSGLISLPIINPYDDTSYDLSTCTLVLKLMENQNYYEFNATEPDFHLELNGGEETLDCNANAYYDDIGAQVVTPTGNSVSTIYASPFSLATGGSKTLTYEIYSGGTLVDSIDRTLNINNPNTPTIVIGDNISSIDVAQGSTFSAPSAIAYDDCEMDLTVTTSGSVNTSVLGTYTITYSTNNGSGISASKNLTVNVVDGTLPGWLYKKELVIDHSKIDSNLTDFPLTVVLSNTNFDFTQAETNGEDIRFTDSNDNLLSFERELHYAPHEEASYHVKVPNISSTTDTIIYMYYGNSTATDSSNSSSVWDSNYVMVNHMGNSLLDSTSNNNDAINSGTVMGGSATMVGESRMFASGNYIYVPRNSNLEPTSEITFSALAQRNGAQQSYAKILWYSRNNASPYGAYGFQFSSTSDTDMESKITISGTSHEAEYFTVNDNTYYYFTGRYTGASVDGFHNTTSITSSPATGSINDYDGTNGLGIGDKYETGQYFTGIIDEVRISNIARSDAWLKAEYYSLFNNLIKYFPTIIR